MNKEEIQARIKELQKRIDALPNWGAAVSLVPLRASLGHIPSTTRKT